MKNRKQKQKTKTKNDKQKQKILKKVIKKLKTKNEK